MMRWNFDYYGKLFCTECYRTSKMTVAMLTVSIEMLVAG